MFGEKEKNKKRINIIKDLSVLALFIVLTFILTYPLGLNLKSHIPGFMSTDEPLHALWQLWYINYAFQNNFNLEDTHLIAYPFEINPLKTPIKTLLTSVNFFLSERFSHFLVYNYQILINFFLTGLFTYFLVLHLTKNRLASILSGIIFTFCPQHFARSWQHLGLSYFEWMPLYLLALFKLKEKPNFKYAILTALALFLVASFDVHYLLFMLVATAAFVLYLFIFQIRNRLSFVRHFKYLSLAGILAFLFIILQFFQYIMDILKAKAVEASSHSAYVRPFENLFSQSAKPLSYFLPSVEHPIFGKFTQYFVGDFLYGHSFTEHTLYLGWTTIILAFIAFCFWRNNHMVGTNKADLEKRENFVIGYFILLAIVAWFFSQPPWWKIGTIRIFMPSFLMYKILPMVRAYCRFGILVLLALSVLAGFGLKFILEKIKSNFKKALTTLAFCSLVLFEFFHIPSEHVIDLSKTPAVYEWLKEQREDFVIAEYPLDVEGQEVSYLFNQTKHHKKMINGTIPGTEANKVSRSITKLSESKTASVLKWLGVKYVLVHADVYENSGALEEKTELDNIKKNKNLKFVNNFGDIDVYEVAAKPIKPEMVIEKVE